MSIHVCCFMARVFLSSVHPGHLCPCHHSGSKRSGQDHGKGPDGGTVNIKKSLPKEREPGGKNTASGHVFCPVWVTVWVTSVSRKWGRPPKLQKGREKHRFPAGKRCFCVLNDRNRYALKIRNIKGWNGFALFESYNYTIHSPQN